MTTEAQELVVDQPLMKEVWKHRTQGFVDDLEQRARDGMARLGTVVSDLTMEVAEETELGGVRLHGEDDDGNPIPPMVVVRFKAMAIPHKEVDDG